MRFFLFIFFVSITLLSSCSKKNQTEVSQTLVPQAIIKIPTDTVDIGKLLFNKQTSEWNLGDQLYTGYATERYPDNSKKSIIAFNKGKKQNEAVFWRSDGKIQKIANYHQGKLHGKFKEWTAIGRHHIISSLNYSKGKVHGQQLKWYLDGTQYQILNYNQGKEEGIQKAFRKNGDLYANFEVKNGRVFGLKKAALCYGIEKEKVKYAK